MEPLYIMTAIALWCGKTYSKPDIPYCRERLTACMSSHKEKMTNALREEIVRECVKKEKL